MPSGGSQAAPDHPDWGLHANLHDDAESLQNAALDGSQAPDSVQTYLDTYYRRAGICLLPGESADTNMADNAYDSHRWVQTCG